MSRAIKFRAWCPKCSRFEPIPLWEKENLSGEDDFSVWMDDLVIEQYTGLKDKNGKEIYEGDILQNADGETATVVWCEETAEWGIEWSDCEVRDSLSWRMTCVKESDSLNEVIGNIHENPELLGGED